MPRISLVLCGLLILSSVCPADEPPFELQLPTDPLVKAQFTAIEDLVKKKEWARAAESLQDILDQNEEKFLQAPRRGDNGHVRMVWVMARTEADRFLGELPEE